MWEKSHTPSKGGSFLPGRTLKNKPLVESIFELHWDLQVKDAAQDLHVDPHYKLLVGRLFDRLSRDYPHHEELPAAAIPDEMVAHIVQHRFRASEDGWPVVQVGPGVITVNETEGYTWDGFRPRVLSVVRALFEVYPNANQTLRVKRLIHRNIDAMKFDYNSADILAYLAENLKLRINLEDSLFSSTGVEPTPIGHDLRLSFRSTKPPGAISIKFVRGQKEGHPALVWETVLYSEGPDAKSQSVEDVEKWLDAAHHVTSDWFFKLIEGKLRQQFE